MSDAEKDKQAGHHEVGRGQSCPLTMYPCIDKTSVCLTHSHDPDKDGGAFQGEFERILRDAGEGIADFREFVFPKPGVVRRLQ